VHQVKSFSLISAYSLVTLFTIVLGGNVYNGKGVERAVVGTDEDAGVG
jgi:hypothetical protein